MGWSQTPPHLIPDDVRRYSAYRADGVRVDGVLDDAAWTEASRTEPFVDIRSVDHPAPAWETWARIAWDSDYLYVAARLIEPHLWATLTERDAIIYRDHDFEVFLDPDGDGLAYYEIEINAFGTIFDLFLDRPYREGGRAHIPWDLPGMRSAVNLEGTLNDPSDQDVAWTLEMAIPWRELAPPGAPRSAAPPQDGDVWRVNFSRVQWPLEIRGDGYVKAREPSQEDPHPEDNWVWSPQGEINMHIPERWGAVTFVDGSPGGR
jgi:hypothetical protein